MRGVVERGVGDVLPRPNRERQRGLTRRMRRADRAMPAPTLGMAHARRYAARDAERASRMRPSASVRRATPILARASAVKSRDVAGCEASRRSGQRWATHLGHDAHAEAEPLGADEELDPLVDEQLRVPAAHRADLVGAGDEEIVGQVDGQKRVAAGAMAGAEREAVGRRTRTWRGPGRACGW